MSITSSATCLMLCGTTHLLHRLAQLGVNSLVLGPQLSKLQWSSTDQIGESAITSSLIPSLS
jgi:hypothetical protein